MSACGKCHSQVSRTIKNKIQCKLCKGYFHGVCVNLTVTEVEVITSGGQWCCDSCTKKRRASRSFSDSTPVASSPTQPSQTSPSPSASTPAPADMAITMEVLKTLLDQVKKEIIEGQGNIEKELGKSLEQCFVRIGENNELIKRQQEVIVKQEEMIHGLQEENRHMGSQVKTLSKRLGDLEQYSRRNTLEIFGIPKSPNESNSSLKTTVIEVGAALGVKISEDGIDACHRIDGGNNRPTPGIIVKFLRREDPDQLLARRKVKRDLSTRHLGHTTDSVIYVNPSLTPARRVLLAKARKLRADFGYRFVWADRAGRVKVRKSDDRSSRVIVLNDEDELNALVQKESAVSRDRGKGKGNVG